MQTLPVLILLCVDVLIFLGAAFLWDESPARKENLLLCTLFLASGVPALIYQVVWQRTLFAIYGVNAESVAAVVSAFMLGLGLGGLLGGWLSARYPKHALLFFGFSELGVAVFGLSSLRIFHWAAALSAGANLFTVICFSTAVLLVPTLLMGATLPLLVEHFVSRSSRVGISVSRLYFANTLGSAVACYLCATYVLRSFGQGGSVMLAAFLNTLIGATAYLYGRYTRKSVEQGEATPNRGPQAPVIVLWKAAFLAALAGFISLGFEIAWFRVFALASGDRAPAFALLLATFLAGIAGGAYVCEKITADLDPAIVLRTVGVLLLLSGALSPFLPGLVATLLAHKFNYLWSAPAFFIVAGMVGCILPLLCQLSVVADEKAGRKVGLIYASNIAGSVLGSLGIGFVWMQFFGLRTISLQLAALAVIAGAALLLYRSASSMRRPVWSWALILLSAAAVPLSLPTFHLLYERLIFASRPASGIPFARIVENRNGVICVTRENTVFGGGVYDGYFLIDPAHDTNQTVRAFALMAIHPAPKRILMIGLSSGSWAQILVNAPHVEHVDVVEINPGYLKLIPEYPVVRSLLQNPKLHVYVDDGRRWLMAHPDEKYDMIVSNTTFHWRDHSTPLLSREYCQMTRGHLNPGGLYYFNTTDSNEAIATALSVYPSGLRIMNFLAVSDTPIFFDKQRWFSALLDFRIDGQKRFDPANQATAVILPAYNAFADTLYSPPRLIGLESSDSLRQRLGAQRLITDDNMGREWSTDVVLLWR
jgi:spermidine synthase